MNDTYLRFHQIFLELMAEEERARLVDITEELVSSLYKLTINSGIDENALDKLINSTINDFQEFIAIILIKRLKQ